MRAAFLRHIGGIGEDGKPRAHAAKLRHILGQLACDRPLARPAIDELHILALMTREDVRHGVLVDAPAADDGDRVVRDVRVETLLDIVLEQDADGRSRASERDERGIRALFCKDPLGEARRRARRDLGIARERVEVSLQVLLRRLVFERQHFRIMLARLDELLPLRRRQRLDLSCDVLQEDRHVVLAVCAEHRPLLPLRHDSRLIR